MRVEIPEYTDRWLQGDRYGTVIGQWKLSAGGIFADQLRVQLDKSGKKISVNADHCRVVESD